ncbi:DUF802 domain-containing protein [Pandoraea apista]|uniref:DUF802 domain-containing protein n=1 Tax=Pandoraea apista TaxID=93218 RepID=UPI0006578F9E|nr:DUF802 domain-containing protein [Pandoraea apista]ALS66916.1 hypothetical protein AT395_19780 [Pandoraea apista]RRW97205.1 DUF802 domain-containing protein [Pandoraea apista]RRX04051.1 DUF802 domain-containing protein [Pandoraea apista]CFB61017.1 hypothetical protein LMG16407_01066 [Pandoraea apista]
MTRYLVDLVAFVAGLAVVGWIAVGYAGTNNLALAVALLIAAVYLFGALELKRFHQATNALANAVSGLNAPPTSLPSWLDTLPAGLRTAVRLRVEGERVGLPGPALTPYLVGLLVLLGMLGTFLGMAATLRGTGLALEGATDLEAIRASLASPVKGLGFAFGTSVAGVATSAMLGLLAALARKQRAQVVQSLDARIVTTLRGFSQQHQRETTLQLLQQQATVMPALVDRLQDMMAAMERQSQALGERLVANQDALHAKTDASYAQLTSAMQQYLKDSVATTASAAGAAIRPEVEATMASLARETASWHQTVSGAMQDRMDGLSDRFEATTARVANVWKDSLDAQLRANELLATDLRAALSEFTQTFDARSSRLVDDVASRLETVTGHVSSAHAGVAQTWETSLAAQQRTNDSLAKELGSALSQFTQTFESRSAKLVDEVATRLETATGQVSASHAGVAQTWEASLAAQQQTNDALAKDLGATLAQFAQTFETRSAGLLADVTTRLDNATGSIATAQTTVAQAWEQALAQQQRSHNALTQDLGTALERFAQTFELRSGTLLADVAAKLDAASGNVAGAHERVAQAWDQSIALQQQANAALNTELAAALTRFSETFEQRSAHLIDGVSQRTEGAMQSVSETAAVVSGEWKHALTAQQSANEALARDLASALARFADTFETRASQLLQSVSAQMDSTSENVAQTWRDAIAEHARTSERLADGNQQLVAATTHAFTEHSASLLQALNAANAAHHDATAERETQRLSAWTETLEGTLATLRSEWQQVGAQTASQQQAICDTLARTALEMSEQTRANASDTIAEISRLVQTASEAPKAAAEIIGELRQKLSDSMVRDNAMLEERSRLLDTLGTLLDTVKHAGNEQRAAVDELVTTSAQLLERAGANLGDAIAAQTEKLTAASAQVAGSAVEIASLGDAFGAAVQSFGESNTQLLEHLQRIEAALDKSMARSDEQLGYYVAQAREVVELSVMSQKQILENLQDLAQTRAQPGSVAA